MVTFAKEGETRGAPPRGCAVFLRENFWMGGFWVQWCMSKHSRNHSIRKLLSACIAMHLLTRRFEIGVKNRAAASSILVGGH